MRRLAIALVTLLVPSCGDPPLAPTPPSLSARPSTEAAASLAPDHGTEGALALLRRAPQFESSGIGFAGAPSDYVRAWRRVLASADADARFKELLATAVTREGRLDARVGLYVTDRRALAAAIRDPGWQRAEVETQFGCIGGRMPARDVLEGIANGDWSRDFLSDGRIPPPAA